MAPRKASRFMPFHAIFNEGAAVTIPVLVRFRYYESVPRCGVFFLVRRLSVSVCVPFFQRDGKPSHAAKTGA